jgi:hypothetical protein
VGCAEGARLGRREAATTVGNPTPVALPTAAKTDARNALVLRAAATAAANAVARELDAVAAVASAADATRVTTQATAHE